MSEVKKFDHEVFGELRVVIQADKEMFIASDVAKSLEYSSNDKAYKHCKSLILFTNAIQEGLHPSTKVCPESDVYRMIMRSTKDKAAEYQDWVCEVILPTLRKEDMYIVDEEKVSSGEMSEDELILKAMNLMQTKVERYKFDKEVAEAESSRLTIECATITNQFISDGQTAPKFCRKFNGVNINQVQNYLCEKNLLLPKSKTGWSPTSYARDRYLTERTSVHFGIPISTCILTKEGAKWLYKKYLKGDLPMKTTWDGLFTSEVFED